MIVWILIIAHLLANFTFQSAALAEKRKTIFKAMLQHAVIYFFTFFIPGVLFIERPCAYYVIYIIIFSHFAIDWMRQGIEEKLENKSQFFWTFIADQALHLLVILVTAGLFNVNAHGNMVYDWLSKHYPFNHIVLFLFLFILVLKPAATFIKKLFGLLFNETEENKDNQRVGNIIGKLERIITVFLVLCNQYGAVGLILTAKSIARFKQMEDKNFAEKYLVGTLTSLSIALIATIVVAFLLK